MRLLSIQEDSAALRLRLVRDVASDGEFSAQEREDLKAGAQTCGYTALLDLMTCWEDLRDGNSARGFDASELAVLIQQDPQLVRTWARLGRDQIRFQNYFGRNFGQPLLASASAANDILMETDGRNLHGEGERREEFERLVTALSSDLFAGRDAGTWGGQCAARYLKDEIRDTLGWQIRTQSVPIPRQVNYDSTKNYIQVGDYPHDPEDPNIPEPYLYSAPKVKVTATAVTLPVFYSAQDLQVVSGKIVIFKPTEEDMHPQDPGKKKFDTLEAAQAVMQAGAVGVLFVSNELDNLYLQWPQNLALRIYAANLYTYWYPEPDRQKLLMGQATGFADYPPLLLSGPVFSVSEFADCYERLSTLTADTMVTLQTDIDWEIATGENIIAMLPTPDQDPVVMLSAHYDHLGTGKDLFQPSYGLIAPSMEALQEIMHRRDTAQLEDKNLFERGQPLAPEEFRDQEAYAKALESYGFVEDQVFNGAVDNASGCALTLLLARALQEKVPLGLAFFTGEEFGLWGSKALARDWQKFFPERDLGLLVNFDMPCVEDPQYPLTIPYYFGGQSDTHLDEIILLGTNQLIPNHNVLCRDCYPKENFGARSDQASFQDQRFSRARTLYLTGGMNPEYHSVLDEAKIVNYEKGLAILKLSENFLLTLQNAGLRGGRSK